MSDIQNAAQDTETDDLPDNDQIDDLDTEDAPSELETQARELGWKSEEEWVGDPPPGGFMTAERFIERAEERQQTIDAATSAVQSRYDDLQAKYDKLEKRSQMQDDWLAKVRQEEYDRALEAIRAEQSEAIEAGDGEAYEAARKKEDSLQKPEPAPDPEPAPQGSQAFENWVSENKWYNDDAAMGGYADRIAPQIRADLNIKGQQVPEAEFYRMVTDRVKEQFADKFESRPRVPPSPERGQRQRSGNGKGWSDIPSAERKEIEDVFFGPGRMYEKTAKDRAAYAATYWAQEREE